MKYDIQKAFPYPVLRPNSDDYKDCEFQAVAEFSIEKDIIGIEISYALSSNEILLEIDQGNAEYVAVISCRDTYFRSVLSSQSNKQKALINAGDLRGEVKIDPYIVVKKEIAEYICSDFNDEFGVGPFRFEPGDILAQDESQVFFIDRDLFKPVTSVFELVKKDSLEGSEWTLGYEEQHVQIQLSPQTKGKIDDARNNTKNRAILLNSIYFAAVMQAIQQLVNSDEYDGYKWGRVIRGQAHNKGIDLAAHDAYLSAQKLMQYPLGLLDICFKGGE